MAALSLGAARAAQEQAPDESLITKSDAVATYEPPPTLPLPESFFAPPPAFKALASTKRQRPDVAVPGSFRCPTDSSSVVVLPLSPRVVTTVVGPQGDELRFTGASRGGDQLVRKTMRHGDVLFCLKRASGGETPPVRYVLNP